VWIYAIDRTTLILSLFIVLIISFFQLYDLTRGSGKWSFIHPMPVIVPMGYDSTTPLVSCPAGWPVPWPSKADIGWVPITLYPTSRRHACIVCNGVHTNTNVDIYNICTRIRKIRIHTIFLLITYVRLLQLLFVICK